MSKMLDMGKAPARMSRNWGDLGRDRCVHKGISAVDSALNGPLDHGVYVASKDEL